MGTMFVRDCSFCSISLLGVNEVVYKSTRHFQEVDKKFVKCLYMKF
jgi:hypothetical protein